MLAPCLPLAQHRGRQRSSSGSRCEVLDGRPTPCCFRTPTVGGTSCRAATHPSPPHYRAHHPSAPSAETTAAHPPPYHPQPTSLTTRADPVPNSLSPADPPALLRRNPVSRFSSRLPPVPSSSVVPDEGTARAQIDERGDGDRPRSATSSPRLASRQTDRQTGGVHPFPCPIPPSRRQNPTRCANSIRIARSGRRSEVWTRASRKPAPDGHPAAGATRRSSAGMMSRRHLAGSGRFGSVDGQLAAEEGGEQSAASRASFERGDGAS